MATAAKLNDDVTREANGGRARVVILATGGTIAGAAAAASDSLRYQAGALKIDTLLAAVPGLDTLAQVDAEQIASIDSKDASPSFWCDVSRRVNALLARDDVDGVVITHGTDTLEETAYWLHLTVASHKPVVMTAAMRPATASSADGPANLFDAVTVAASPQAVGQGVLIAFANRIHSARDVTKGSSHAVDAFVSPGTGPLGWVQDGKLAITRHPSTRHTTNSQFARVEGWDAAALVDVGIVMSYAGASDRMVRALCADDVKGIVVAGTGNGSIHRDVLLALIEAADAGVAVVRSSRTADIRVTEAVDDRQLGFVAAGTLNPYKARVLLMLAAASGEPIQAIRDMFAQY